MNKLKKLYNWLTTGSDLFASNPVVIPELRFKALHSKAVLPCKAALERDHYLTGDSGYDLFAVEGKEISPNSSEVIDVGLQLAYVTPGYWFRIEARSGLGFKHGVQPHFGIIDNPYRGILTVKLYNLSKNVYVVNPGDKIAQLVLFPLVKASIIWSDEIHETHRGGNRLGSSGR